MLAYPWWVIHVNESPLSSTCFTVWLYGAVLAGLASMYHLAWLKVTGKVDDWDLDWNIWVYVLASIWWPLALPVLATWGLWRAMLKIATWQHARQARQRVGKLAAWDG